MAAAVVRKDVGDFFPIPRYDDYQAKLTFLLRKDEALDVLFLASDDHLQRTIASADPAARKNEQTNLSYYRAAVRYSRLLADGSSFVVMPSFGYDMNHFTQNTGPNPTRLDNDTMRFSLRASYRGKLAKGLTLSTGADVQSAPSTLFRTGSFNLPPREGDPYVFGQPPSDDVSSDRWRTTITDVAPYAFLEWSLGPLTIAPGMRLDAFLIDVSRMTPKIGNAPGVGSSNLQWGPEPRLTVAYKPHARVQLNAAGGLYHQAPDPEDTSAVFGTPTLGLQRAVHVSVGGAVKLTGTLSFEAVGFVKVLNDLVQRSAITTPAAGHALTQDGSGLSYGGQFLLRQELWKGFFGWVTYSLTRSERRDHPTSAVRLSDYDQTHVLGVVASYEWKKFTFGTRVRLTSGMPRVAVLGSFYDAKDDVYQPILGPRNSTRLPMFFALDLRAERSFTFGEGRFQLSVYLDVQNVTNYRNAEEVVYNYDYSQKSYVSGLPILAVLGARFQF
jgi:hypothetical protein